MVSKLADVKGFNKHMQWLSKHVRQVPKDGAALPPRLLSFSIVVDTGVVATAVVPIIVIIAVFVAVALPLLTL